MTTHEALADCPSVDTDGLKLLRDTCLSHLVKGDCPPSDLPELLMKEHPDLMQAAAEAAALEEEA